MSRIRTPENIEIASLKKKKEAAFDPMASGVGTPWEDRGTHGTVGAFFKTCTGSMFGPAKLMSTIRRPETTNDARAFLFGICVIWGLSALEHQMISIWFQSRPADAEVLEPNAAIWCLLALVAGSVGTFFLYRIYNLIYARLVTQEKGSVLLPDTLLYNVNVYAFGPSLLALIPYAGPPIAILWIFVNLVVAGSSRLRLRMAPSIIDAVLSLLAVLAIAGVAYFIIEVLILHKLMGFDPVDIMVRTDFGPFAR